MIDYFKEQKNIISRQNKMKKYFLEVLDRKKISIDDRRTIFDYARSIHDYGMFIFFALKKSDEPRQFQGNILTESRRDFTKEDLTYTYHKNGYECQTITLPWFLVWDLYDRLAKKYFKGPAHEEEININHKQDIFSFDDPFKMTDWVSPSQNPLYYWTKEWEYGVNPLDHKNLREFMRARAKGRKKYSQQVVEAQVKEKIQKEAEEERARIIRKKEHNTALRSKRYESIDTLASDPAVYVICEKNKILTKIKNKCNALYVGESAMMAKRAAAYSDLNRPNNELVQKLIKKLKKSREYVLEKLNKNIHVRIFRNKNITKPERRLDIEGYLINRLNPLLNTSKRNGFFKRSFITQDYSIDFWMDLEEVYRAEIYHYGDSETIFHVGKKKFVKRESEDGEEAEEIQFGRSFDTWCKQNRNDFNNRVDEWREDREAFFDDVIGKNK